MFRRKLVPVLVLLMSSPATSDGLWLPGTGVHWQCWRLLTFSERAKGKQTMSGSAVMAPTKLTKSPVAMQQRK